MHYALYHERSKRVLDDDAAGSGARNADDQGVPRDEVSGIVTMDGGVIDTLGA